MNVFLDNLKKIQQISYPQNLKIFKKKTTKQEADKLYH